MFTSPYLARKCMFFLLYCKGLPRNCCLFYVIVEKTADCFIIQDFLGSRRTIIYNLKMSIC